MARKLNAFIDLTGTPDDPAAFWFSPNGCSVQRELEVWFQLEADLTAACRQDVSPPSLLDILERNKVV